MARSILEDLQFDMEILREEIEELKFEIIKIKAQRKNYSEWERISAGDCNLESLYQSFKQRMESER